MTTHDYIVVGGGSAGCVLVNRLIKAGRSVLLLEAGPADNTLFIHVPATFVKVIGSRRSFMYTTEPQPGANGRTMVVPQGRTLGGGSSLNAMIYIRGQREDYDEWERLGCTGWSYEDVLPVFRRSEGNERLAGPFHGTAGTLKVSDPRFRHPVSSAFVRAAQQAGYAYSDDFNGARQDGVDFYQTTTFNGRRGSTATMFLKPVQTSPLLTLRTECQVTDLVLENGAATGLTFRGKDGTVGQARAREEIVLTAGAIGTPKILMLAGIGPSAELARHGIATRRHLPGVGENFQDHIAARVRHHGPADLAFGPGPRLQGGRERPTLPPDTVGPPIVECHREWRLSGYGRERAASISPHKRENWLLLMPSMPRALARSSTDRVEMPWM